MLILDAAGEAFVRELDVSRITVRLIEKQDKKGDNDSESTIAKLQGVTIDTLQRCLVGFMCPCSAQSPANAALLVQTYRTGA